MIYVDDLVSYPGKGVWCHMWGSPTETLHRVARSIGLKRDWYQEHEHPRKVPHYDLRPSWREAALKFGAVEGGRAQLRLEIERRLAIIEMVERSVLPVLSIRQPWLWAILHCGKDIENRSWQVNYQGPLLLHASKTYDADGETYLRERGYEVPSSVPMGGIAGVGMLRGCVDMSDSEWFFGPWGWKLRSTLELPLWSWKGRQGIFHATYGWFAAQEELKRRAVAGECNEWERKGIEPEQLDLFGGR